MLNILAHIIAIIKKTLNYFVLFITVGASEESLENSYPF